jgi:hypothetical protein
MDFYHIGAMNVFSQLGQLIEEDESNQIKLTDLSCDIMQQIGSYLLEDKNKTIHKIFKDKQDDDLQVLLFGEMKDLTYVNIHDSSNKIDYPMNDKLKDYVHWILKAKGSKSTCEKVKVNFYEYRYKHYYPEIKVVIIFLNKKEKEIASIEQASYHDGPFNSKQYKYTFSFKHDNGWSKQSIQKKDIIDEYETISKDIINKYF